jgi:non-ribosomal peptide synthetase component F
VTNQLDDIQPQNLTPRDAGKIAQAQARLEDTRLRIGRAGLYFGDREHAATWLTSAIILICLVAGGLIAICEPALRSDYMKAVLGLLLAAFGYLAGAISSRGGAE